MARTKKTAGKNVAAEAQAAARKAVSEAQAVARKVAAVEKAAETSEKAETGAEEKETKTAAAVKNAAGAASNKVAKLTDSELGAMAEALAGAQYSQKQENEADEYGVEFCVKNNIDPYAMANALTKLAELAKDAPKSSYVQRMFSSHPDTAKRIERAKAKADSYKK